MNSYLSRIATLTLSAMLTFSTLSLRAQDVPSADIIDAKPVAETQVAAVEPKSEAEILKAAQIHDATKTAAESMDGIKDQTKEIDAAISAAQSAAANGNLEALSEAAGKLNDAASAISDAAAATQKAIAPVNHPFIGTAWGLLPPLLAIILALITKEVFSSLFIGLFAGALLYTRFNFMESFTTLISDGMIAALSAQAGIFIFLVLLGILVALISKTGATMAFGNWAKTHVKTRIGAMLATFILGVLIFIDDYFNCLTVGSVMLPVTDSKRISRAKLAYLIDATAAPICMIAPVSSWAAAVSDFAPDGNGFQLFCRAIPFNFYSLLTLIFIIAITLLKLDYGPMARHERNAIEKGDLFTSGTETAANNIVEANAKGRVTDMLIPVIILIGICIFTLVYVGGYFDPSQNLTFAEAFAGTDAGPALALGGLFTLIVTIVYLAARRTIPVRKMMDCLPQGFVAMVPAITILTLATSLNKITRLLQLDHFIARLMESQASSLLGLLPVAIFLVACGLSFATGTSWGTFGILIPIVTKMYPADSSMLIISMSACLAGAVCGDHCSPISDTTIMSSAGARCDHINHVSTQLPYAITVAILSGIGFLLSGLTQNYMDMNKYDSNVYGLWGIIFPIMVAITIVTLVIIKKITIWRKK